MKKRLIRILAVMTVLALLCSSVAFAVEPRESAYISSKGGGITATGNGNMRIAFSVVATGMMDELGASSIHIYTEDDDLAATIRYTDPGCSNMMTKQDYSYDSSVNWQGVSGERYYAIITFYAKNSMGYDYRGLITSTVQV